MTTHTNADIDRLASMLALWLFEARLNPEAMRWRLFDVLDAQTREAYAASAGINLPLSCSYAVLRQRLKAYFCGRRFFVSTVQSGRIGAASAVLGQCWGCGVNSVHASVDGELHQVPPEHTGAYAAAMILQPVRRNALLGPQEIGFWLDGKRFEAGDFISGSTLAQNHRAALRCPGWCALAQWLLRDTPQNRARNQSNVVAQQRGAKYKPLAVPMRCWVERLLCSGGSLNAQDIGARMGGLNRGGHLEATSAAMRRIVWAAAQQVLRSRARIALWSQGAAGRWVVRPAALWPAWLSMQDAAEAQVALRLIAAAHPGAIARGQVWDQMGRSSWQQLNAAWRSGFAERLAGDCWGSAAAWVPKFFSVACSRRGSTNGSLGQFVPSGDAPAALRALLQATGVEAQLGAQRPPQPQALWQLMQRTQGDLWAAVMQLVGLCRQLGMTISLVGGQVRDVLRAAAAGRHQAPACALGDIDLVVEGDAQALARAAVAAFGGAQTLPPNAFMTARWQPSAKFSIDLATARCELYLAPAALPQVGHACLKDDLFRRDFTVNAMALGLCDKNAGRLFDPCGGFADLQASQLRVLHPLSFRDDPTRVLRAVRLAARLNFTLAPSTRAALREAVATGGLLALTAHRLGAELQLILGEAYVVQAFALMRQWGILAVLGFEAGSIQALIDNLEKTRSARCRLTSRIGAVPSQADVLWLVVGQSLTPAVRRARSGWIGAGGQALQRFVHGPDKIRQAFSALSDSDVHGRNDALGCLDAAERLCLFGALTQPEHEAVLIWWETIGRHLRSVVDGRTLLQMGYKQGPAFRPALAAALHAAQDGGDAQTQQRLAQAVLDAHRQ